MSVSCLRARLCLDVYVHTKDELYVQRSGLYECMLIKLSWTSDTGTAFTGGMGSFIPGCEFFSNFPVEHKSAIAPFVVLC